MKKLFAIFLILLSSVLFSGCLFQSSSPEGLYRISENNEASGTIAEIKKVNENMYEFKVVAHNGKQLDRPPLFTAPLNKKNKTLEFLDVGRLKRIGVTFNDDYSEGTVFGSENPNQIKINRISEKEKNDEFLDSNGNPKKEILLHVNPKVIERIEAFHKFVNKDSHIGDLPNGYGSRREQIEKAKQKLGAPQ